MKLFLTIADIRAIEDCSKEAAILVMKRVRAYTESLGGMNRRGKCVTRDYADLYHLNLDDIYLFLERMEDERDSKHCY